MAQAVSYIELFPALMKICEPAFFKAIWLSAFDDILHDAEIKRLRVRLKVIFLGKKGKRCRGSGAGSSAVALLVKLL